MKKQLFLFLVCILSLGSSYGQVFISEYFEEEIIVGPENIEFSRYEIANFYLTQIVDLIVELKEGETNNFRLITYFKS